MHLKFYNESRLDQGEKYSFKPMKIATLRKKKTNGTAVEEDVGCNYKGSTVNHENVGLSDAQKSMMKY